MLRPLSSLLAIALFACASVSYGGHEIVTGKETVVETPFDKGKVEFQLGVGAFTSFQTTSSERPKFTDGDLSVRVGTMLYTPAGEGCFRGNLELLLEAFGAGLVDGPETGYAGLALILRYNLVQPGARWIPYVQIQGGGVYNDIYQDGTQRVFGRSIEFDLGAGLGIRYLVSDRLAYFLEADYRHVSNAGTASRNLGLNSVGGLFGVSCFF